MSSSRAKGLMQKTHIYYDIYSLLLPVGTVPNAVKATPCDMAVPKTSLQHAGSISFQTSVWLMRGTHCNGPTDSWSRDSSVSTVTGLWVSKSGFDPGQDEQSCVSSKTYTPTLGPTKPLIRRIRGSFPRAVRPELGVVYPLHLAPKLRMSAVVTYCHSIGSRRGLDNVTFC